MERDLGTLKSILPLSMELDEVVSFASRYVGQLLKPQTLDTLLNEVHLHVIDQDGPIVGHKPTPDEVQILKHKIASLDLPYEIRESLNRAMGEALECGLSDDTVNSILKKSSWLSPEQKREIEEILGELASWIRYSIAGTYNHQAKVITIYRSVSLADVEQKKIVFGHEFFHAIHHYIRDSYDPKHYDFCGLPCKKTIVVESLASYFEAELCDYVGDTIAKQNLLKTRRYPMDYFPYSGAKYITNKRHMLQILHTSLFNIDDAYYELTGKQDCHLRQELLRRARAGRVRGTMFGGIPYTIIYGPAAAPLLANAGFGYIIYLIHRDGTVDEIPVTSNSNFDDRRIRSNVNSNGRLRKMHEQGKLADAAEIVILRR